jgi:hypothetical protein
VRRAILVLTLATGCGAASKPPESARTPSAELSAPSAGAYPSSPGSPGADSKPSATYDDATNQAPAPASVPQTSPNEYGNDALQRDRDDALRSIKARNCVDACRALTALERTVSRLCSVEPARCAAATETAKRTHAQVVEACPTCASAP